MKEILKEQILKIRDSGKTNMFDVKKVFELAVESGFDELMDFLFMKTNHYTKFILTGEDSLLED